ncbi:S8 family peptidase [Paenibacillus sp. HN-1]|uniref:S8 family peptidase n=1 Tax=Paenibacillus TaxID=44249 RepID=UPI001CA8B04D|nr:MULTISPECIES: S8 family peptidase [Paenibacillus]MBY9080275.1 S8 family peptidase [Paenibacillus sp. CGMCC 1.18879]MBY9083066.1 S8 family peptidase [Paenibacillus sinensis]
MSHTSWPKEHYAKLNRPLRHILRHLRTKNVRKPLIPVIIQLQQPLTPDRLRMLKRHAAPHKLKIRHRLHLLQSVSCHVPASCLKKLCACGEVSRIYHDRIKRASLNIASPSVGAAAVRRSTGLDGQGIRIAVLDTGVYPHPDLIRPVNRITAFKDFVNHRSRPYDDNGHGTHVAGDAAGNGWSSKGKYKGPAPGAGIVAVKVLDRDGFGYDSTIIKGIEWCIAQRKRLRLRILSLSLGGPAMTPCHDDPLCQAVERAVRAGLVVVIAAGNSGPGRGTIESPGTSPSAITVGAVDDRRTVWQGDDRVTLFSSRGPAAGRICKPDLSAPGESITSLRAPSSALDRELPYLRVGTRYFTLSGTSMSTPIVSGAAALMLQRTPSLTPGKVKKLLKRNTFRLKEPRRAVGSGEVNIRFLKARKRHCR